MRWRQKFLNRYTSFFFAVTDASLFGCPIFVRRTLERHAALEFKWRIKSFVEFVSLFVDYVKKPFKKSCASVNSVFCQDIFVNLLCCWVEYVFFSVRCIVFLCVCMCVVCLLQTCVCSSRRQETSQVINSFVNALASLFLIRISIFFPQHHRYFRSANRTEDLC